MPSSACKKKRAAPAEPILASNTSGYAIAGLAAAIVSTRDTSVETVAAVEDVATACGKNAFFFNDTPTAEMYTLSLHDALPISRAVSDAQATMTQTAQVIGTAQYLSPEQARGERVDARSDLYSTGCLLYELLTGRPPFSGDSPVAIAYQHVRENPVPPSQIDPQLPRWADGIVLKAMAKNPADRYQNAAEMRADIQHAMSGSPFLPPPAELFQHTQ